jgi:hypothetical protein
MFPDGRTGKATKKMLLKHNLRQAAREMNIVPGLHSALVSIPKLADARYTTVFNKDGAAIYDDYTTKITATSPPVLEFIRCEHTGMWKLDLNPAASLPTPEGQAAPLETINVNFNLPSARKTFLWYHASAGFPTKATFIDAVRNGNYSTWPKLTVTLINRYFPDSDETIKGHLKGQRQRIRLTKQAALEKIIENEEVRIKIEGEGSPFHQIPITKTHEAFFRVDDITDSIHTDQTGAFPFTSQRGNRYIMVAIHLDANYIFAEPMRNRTKEEMIRAYEKIINRMRGAGLGIKKAHVGQQYIGCAQAIHLPATNTVQTGPPQQSQTQPSRARHPDFQSAFYRNPGRSLRQVSALPLVPSPQANRTHLKSPPPIQGSSKNIRICPCPRPPRLHEKAICPSRLRNRSPRQTGQPPNLGHEIGCRFQHRHVDGTPPMFSSVCYKNQSNTDK